MTAARASKPSFAAVAYAMAARPGWGLTAVRAATVLLAAGGLGIAMYLTVVHYSHQSIACTGLASCEYVNSTEYAKVVGLPVALLGALAYASILLVVAWAWLRRSPMALLAGWGIALASWVFSMYLTYVELRVIDAICVYCVASACIMTMLLAALSAWVWLERDALLEDRSARG